MRPTKYIIWEEEGQWHGYLQDYPDLPTQGDTFEDLQMKLSDLQRDLDGQEDNLSQYATAVTAPPRVYTPRQLKLRARFEKIFLSMFPMS